MRPGRNAIYMAEPANINPRTIPRSGTADASCIRCGTCCEKGGPSFHLQDRALIETGVIPAACLYTIRKGELARDNVKGGLVPVDADVIKIKGKKDSWTCVFLDERQKACSIYEDRPLECRALKCWDTREIERIYARERLSRRDLLSEIKGLWDIIEDHQARCDYTKIRKLIEAVKHGHRRTARRDLLEIVRYDVEIRQLVVARGELDAEMLNFLFGRPLEKTLANYGFKVRPRGDTTL
jgi:Fe-S-cluster containining protein